MRQLLTFCAGVLPCLVFLTALIGRDLAGADAPTASTAIDLLEIEDSIRLLEQIELGYVESHRSLANVFVRGRVSRVTVPFVEGEPRPTVDTIPPAWRAFTLARRGDNARYEEEYMTLVRGPADQRVYRIMNHSGTAKLDGPAMYIGALEGPSRKWQNLTGPIETTADVYDGRKFGPLPQICKSLVERLKEQQSSAPKDVFKLQCTARDGLLFVECFAGRADFPKDFSFIVDPSKGYNVQNFKMRVGGPGKAMDHEFLRTVDYDEVLPGIYYQRRGVEFFSHEGTVDKRDKTAGYTMQVVEATDIQVGDFEYDMKLFEFDSLPIAKGTMVKDERTQPPLEFKFGEAPLDEQLLTSRLAEREPIRPLTWKPSRYSMLLGLNMLVFCVFATIVAWRYVRRRLAPK